jgi:hypothetical protein
MITRISKIARLPKTIREQLNHRLENGEFGKTILPWLNQLPETQRVLTEHFAGKPITHQNLSEWRRAGYQDWLFLQQRLQWFEQLGEQETELGKHECADAHEAVGSFLLFEIGQSLTALQSIKNPEKHWAFLERLTREFARLQNAYNWSRRVHLEWDKYKDQSKSNPPPPVVQFEEEDDEEYYEEENEDNREEIKTAEPNDLEQLESPSESTSASSPALSSEGTPENSPAVHCPENATLGAPASRRPVEPPDPYALARENANLKPACQPIPPLAPTTPPRPRIIPSAPSSAAASPASKDDHEKDITKSERGASLCAFHT